MTNEEMYNDLMFQLPISAQLVLESFRQSIIDEGESARKLMGMCVESGGCDFSRYYLVDQGGGFWVAVIREDNAVVFKGSLPDCITYIHDKMKGGQNV